MRRLPVDPRTGQRALWPGVGWIVGLVLLAGACQSRPTFQRPEPEASASARPLPVGFQFTSGSPTPELVAPPLPAPPPPTPAPIADATADQQPEAVAVLTPRPLPVGFHFTSGSPTPDLVAPSGSTLLPPSTLTPLPEPTAYPTLRPLPEGDPNERSDRAPPISKVSCPPSHPIKGDKTSPRSRVFHVPGNVYYASTVPDECFASESDAVQAGYRPALR
jgi:hypothetical protein